MVIAIISLLVSILLPSLTKARNLARSVACLTHQRNLMIALRYYTEEYGYFPPMGEPLAWYWEEPWHWMLVRLGYSEHRDAPVCPALTDPDPESRLRVGIGLRFDQGYPAVSWDVPEFACKAQTFEAQTPAGEKVILADSSRWMGADDYSFVIQAPNELSGRHGPTVNLGFLDGHAAPIPYDYNAFQAFELPQGLSW